MKREHIAVSAIVLGAVLNLLDAYLAGNLPFSPASSNQQNAVSKINGMTPMLDIGTWLMLAGAGYLVYEYVEPKL